MDKERGTETGQRLWEHLREKGLKSGDRAPEGICRVPSGYDPKLKLYS